MKAFVSYVLQNERGHRHYSEIVDIKNPPYNYSSLIDGTNILEWSKNKKKNLNQGEELVVLNYFKL